MIRHLRAFYNPWFILPFLVWVLIGAVLLAVFDRQVLFGTVNMHHTPFLDVLMNVLTEMGNGVGIAIVLLALLLFRSCRDWWYMLTAIVCNVVPALLIQVLKAIFDAPRPFEYYKADPSWIHWEPGWGEKLFHHSFPSGHSAGVFSMCCFLSLILPRRYAWLGIVLFFFALTVGYTRMYLAAHFYADVFAGSIVGTTTTLFCFAIMRRISRRSFVLSNHTEKRSTFI